MDAQVSDTVIEKAADNAAGLLFKFVNTEWSRSEVRFQDLTDAEREELLARTWESIKSACRVVAQTLATMGQPSVKGTLDSATVKDQFVAKVSISRNVSGIHTLLDNVGQPVLIVLAQAEMEFGRQPHADGTGELLDAEGEAIDDESEESEESED